MKRDSFMEPLEGIIVPLVSPLLDSETLDEPGLGRLIEHVIAGGVQGIFILGTTGEGPSLSLRLKRSLIEQTCRAVGGRVPVLVGVLDTSLSESLALAAWAAEKGAAAVVAVPPYYLPLDPPELIHYIGRLAERMPLPVYLYNQPEYTRAAITPEILARVADRPNLVGLKDTSGNMIHFQQMCRLMRDRQEFSLFVGPDGLTAEAVLMGGSGGVNAGANLAPALYVALYRAARSGDLAGVRRLQDKVLRFIEAIYLPAAGRLRALKGLKAALARRGICRNVLADPQLAIEPPLADKIAERLAELDLDHPD
ncbi:MAG: dihydrodipicolinate synthase family protein [Sedimentisphaerales bacterium]|nr:dihydrodipicolinate synthase family protein [Sedimentisphaerales bacterium]